MKLDARMKKYEKVMKSNLLGRTPVIIRIDGKAFHTWTKTLDRPFDAKFSGWMANTAQYLVENIQNAVLAYTQSDEISILLRDYDNLNTEQWFNGGIQKIVSVASSLATAQFNYMVSQEEEECYRVMPLALFDARVFNVPTEEVTNYFIWRQRDCIRNSVSALATHVLTHKVCQGLKHDQKIKKMYKDKGVDWNNLPYHFKHGITFDTRSGKLSTTIPRFDDLRELIDIHVTSNN